MADNFIAVISTETRIVGAVTLTVAKPPIIELVGGLVVEGQPVVPAIDTSEFMKPIVVDGITFGENALGQRFKIG